MATEPANFDVLDEIPAATQSVISSMNQRSEDFLYRMKLDYEESREILARIETLEASYGITPRQSLRK